jgi:hypothetical protein
MMPINFVAHADKVADNRASGRTIAMSPITSPQV